MTETWYAEGDSLLLEAENLLLGHGIATLTRCRQRGANGVAHGGVALFASSSQTKLVPYNFPNPEEMEVLVAEAKIHDISRRMFIIAAYIPPGYSVGKGRACLQHLNNIVLELKTKFRDCHICLGGDFNQWDICHAMSDYPDMTEADTPPTRNNRRIDKVFLNWNVKEAKCLPPLETEMIDGTSTASDHLIQYVCGDVERREKSQWKKITFRPYNEKAAESFKRDLEGESWERVLTAAGSNAKADALQSVLDTLMDKNFPFKTIRRKENGLPWFNETAGRKAKRKRAIYRDEGKSERWLNARDDLDRYLEVRQEKFLEGQRNKFSKPESARQFAHNVRNYNSAEKPKMFDVMDLMPLKTHEEAAEDVAKYFNQISHEFDPLQPWQVPQTYHRQLPRLTPGDVQIRLASVKRPNSMVQGDIFPKLVGACQAELLVPLADIYNCIFDTFVWPIAWKKEFVTVIPKKSLPSSLADLRNISCTKFFSKVFESYVLQYAAEEISIKPNQYGGMKGCSTSHMLLEVWQNICMDLEDYRSATVMTSIDYAKAFNRLSFQQCLAAFKKKGASTTIMRLIATFLTNRQMTVRVGDCWSGLLPVNGGCPQGSKLGVFLFNVTTDDLEDDFIRSEDIRVDGVAEGPPTPTEEALMIDIDQSIERIGQPTTSTPLSGGPDAPDLSLDTSAIGAPVYRHSDLIIEFNSYAVNVPQPPPPHYTPQPREEAVGNQNLVERKVIVVKYVDDNLIVEKVNFGPVQTTVRDGVQVKEKLALGIQNAFQSISTRAKEKGMVVNAAKTIMLCVSDSLNYLPRTFFYEENGTKIECADNMKLLGFNFSCRPTVQLHVESICKKFRQKYWSLRHLRNIGFTDGELVIVYLMNIVPIADYCCVVYHSMLTDEKDELLENAQVGALRAIFGTYKMSARKMREKAGIKTLRQRRIEQCDKFAHKCANSSKFGHWFPIKEGRTSARTGDKYLEEFARCDRLRNSPIFYMRRRLNGKEGKRYGERYRIYRE